MSKKNIIYRVEDNANKVGLFTAPNAFLWRDFSSQHDKIVEKFRNIAVMYIEFDYNVNGRQIWDYKCAFSSLEKLFHTLEIDSLNFLIEKGLSVVEIKASEVVHGQTQAIFIDENVKRKELSIDKLKNLRAKQIAMQDLKEEFKTLREENYIILN